MVWPGIVGGGAISESTEVQGLQTLFVGMYEQQQRAPRIFRLNLHSWQVGGDNSAVHRFYIPPTDIMQFTAAFLALAAFAVSQVSANASIVRQFNALGATDQGALHTCLNNYRTDNWDGMNCGGRGWFKGTHNYKSPENCYDACAGLLVQAIDQGASDVECDDNEGGAKCWMGFH
ncbi:hypothetical protein VTO73DRAFT_4414 [Trametes versicolor]